MEVLHVFTAVSYTRLFKITQPVKVKSVGQG